jgi:sugar phosphate permease
MPFVLFSTFILNMDRTNISNALSDTLIQDLGINLNIFNNATAVYAIFFSIFTISGAVLAKPFGPHRWIPILMFSWGIVTLAHGFIHEIIGYFVVRVLIAITEGGVIPATLVYLGQFYTSRELATRLSWFWGVQALASAISGLMSAGILTMKGIAGLAGWKWLFIIDGIITIIAAFLLYIIFPKDPVTPSILLKSEYRSWFTQHEGRVAITRVIKADPVKLYYNQNVSWSDVKDALTDAGLWGHLLITAIGLTPIVPLSTYLPTIIKSYGFDVYAANALTAPGYILAFITMTINTSHSDKKGPTARALHGIFGAVWLTVGFILLRFLPDDTNKWLLLTVVLFTTSWPLTHPLNISWMTENMAPLGKRTVASGLIIGFANIFAVWASQIYRAEDAPKFRNGNTVNVAVCILAVLLWIGLRQYYINANKKRDALWNVKSKEEKEFYLATTADLGNKRLDFRYAY